MKPEKNHARWVAVALAASTMFATKLEAAIPGWQNSDIGTPVVAGDAVNNGSFLVTGAGRDIWGTSDQFHFVYREESAQNFLFDAYIRETVPATGRHPWSKVGIMIRGGLDADSPFIAAFHTGANGWRIQYRETKGVSAKDWTIETGNTFDSFTWGPRLIRDGNTFYVARSFLYGFITGFGELLDSFEIDMGETVYYGYAVTSHRANQTVTAQFDAPTPGNGAIAYGPTVEPVAGALEPGETAVLSPIVLGESGVPLDFWVLADVEVIAGQATAERVPGSARSFNVTPAPGFSGTVVIEFTVSDEYETANGENFDEYYGNIVRQMAVFDYGGSIGENQPPVVFNKTVNLIEGESAVVDVFAEDFDPDGGPSPLEVTRISPVFARDTAATLLDDGLILVEDGPSDVAVGLFDYFVSDGEAEVQSGLTVNVTPPLPPSFSANSGGGIYDPSGDGDPLYAFDADNGVVGRGYVITLPESREIEGTFDDPLYRQQRLGNNFRYEFPLSPGIYRVGLKFAEPYRTGPGERIFDVLVEGKTVIDDLDIVAEAGGRRTALDYLFNVRVDDGFLNIDFGGQVRNPAIAAVRVSPRPDGGNAAPEVNGNVLLGSDLEEASNGDGTYTIDVLADDVDLDGPEALTISGLEITTGDGVASIVDNKILLTQGPPGSSFVQLTYFVSDGLNLVRAVTDVWFDVN